jgi:hypothetical protein
MIAQDSREGKVDLSLLKKAITNYVTLGYEDIEIKKENDIFKCYGTGNYKIYDEYFEQPLIKMAEEEIH